MITFWCEPWVEENCHVFSARDANGNRAFSYVENTGVITPKNILDIAEMLTFALCKKNLGLIE